MKYKVLKGTDLFNKLYAVHKQMVKASKASDVIWKAIPGIEGVAAENNGIAGGIRGFASKTYCNKNNCPDGWRTLEKGTTKWIFPKSSDKRNKELLEKIYALPIVKEKEIKDLTAYGNYAYTSNGGLCFSTVPNIYWKKNVILIEIADGIEKYEPVEGMIEILASEFKTLNK